MSRRETESINGTIRTLHDIIQDWANQPWAGDRYLSIAAQLWDSLEVNDLIEGPFGVSVTLLESCILDANEGLKAGELDEEQAVEQLTDLLFNEDFAVGARIIEVGMGANPDHRITNVDQLHEESRTLDFRIPRWWKRSVRSYWLFIGGVSFVSMIIFYGLMINLGLRLPINLLLAIAIGVPMFAGAYALRRSQSVNAFKWMWTLFGAFSIGFFVIFAPLILLLGHQLYMILGVWFVWATLIPSMILGAFIGERWGRRRGYRPYF